MENINFSRLDASNQLVFLNTGQLLGVQDISISPSLGQIPLNYVGSSTNQTSYIPNNEQYADVTTNSLLINSDQFFSLIHAEPINLFILKDKNNINDNYCLISGYLNSYSAQYTNGQTPQISTSFRFYNNAGPINQINLDSISSGQLNNINSNDYSYLTNNYTISNPLTVDLTLNEYNTNRVLNFNVNLEAKKTPIYNIGRRNPKRVDTIFPININTSFTFEKGNYTETKLKDLPNLQQKQDIGLDIKTFNNKLISSYNFENMNLINETYGISVDGNATITKQYEGKIRSQSQLDSILNGFYYRILEITEEKRITEDGDFRIRE